MKEEKCQNPWNKNCKKTNIVLGILYKGEELPICASCWDKIAVSAHEWGEDRRPPANATVTLEGDTLLVEGQIRVEDKQPVTKRYCVSHSVTSKVCSKCKVEKSIAEFPNNGRMKDGKGAWCRECCREYNRERRLKL